MRGCVMPNGSNRSCRYSFLRLQIRLGYIQWCRNRPRYNAGTRTGKGTLRYCHLCFVSIAVILYKEVLDHLCKFSVNIPTGNGCCSTSFALPYMLNCMAVKGTSRISVAARPSYIPRNLRVSYIYNPELVSNMNMTEELKPHLPISEHAKSRGSYMTTRYVGCYTDPVTVVLF